MWYSSSLISAGVRESEDSRLGVLGFSVSGIRPVGREALSAKLLELLTARTAGRRARQDCRWKALAWRGRRRVREAERVAWARRRVDEGADIVGGLGFNEGFCLFGGRKKKLSRGGLSDDNQLSCVWEGVGD